jgi:hypothetical protein
MRSNPGEIGAAQWFDKCLRVIERKSSAILFLVGLVCLALLIGGLTTKPVYQSKMTIAPGVFAMDSYGTPSYLDTVFAMAAKISRGAFDDSISRALRERGIHYENVRFEASATQAADPTRDASRGSVVTCRSSNRAACQQMLRELAAVLENEKGPVVEYARRTMDVEIASKRDQIARMKLDLNLLRQRIATAQERIDALGNEKNHLLQETDALRQSMDSLSTEVAVRSESLNALRRKQDARASASAGDSTRMLLLTTELSEKQIELQGKGLSKRANDEAILRIEKEMIQMGAQLGGDQMTISETLPKAIRDAENSVLTLQRRESALTPLRVFDEPTSPETRMSRKRATLRAFVASAFLLVLTSTLIFFARNVRGIPEETLGGNRPKQTTPRQ